MVFSPDYTRRSILCRIIGIGDADYGMIWFFVAVLFGLAGNMVVLLSCISPGTHSVYLFRVGSNELVNATANLTDVSASDLQIAGLPDYCILPGVCAAYDDNDREMFCKHVFPPALSIEEMISFTVEAQLSDGDDPSSITKILSPWTTALAQVKDDLVMPSRLQALMNGAAALGIVSALLSFALLPLTILYLTILHDHLRRWMLYILAFLDALAFLGVALFVEYAMDEGPRSLINLSGSGKEIEFKGPGFVALSCGILIKFLSIEFFLCVACLGVFLVLLLGYGCLKICSGDDRVKVKVDTYVYESSPHYHV
ncbi:hypothetical protein FGRMN_9383 [Fusarium graminum]|nr:hypothetical protein FGRMN_9383 [Fusarium graminum]